MHHHRNGGRPIRLPDPYSLKYHAQKIVLLELIVDPPDAGNRLAALINRLGLPNHAIEPAVAALHVIGLAELGGRRTRLGPARYFEYLWPVLP